jgi:hypothetical protein
MGPTIQWEHSYVTADKIYCVYIPANSVARVSQIIDPTTAEV